MKAFHGKPSVKEFIKACISAGILSANSETGEVFYKSRKLKTVSSRGYVVGTLRFFGARKQIKAHQVVWFCQNQDIPDGYALDHINRIKTDNRLSNLRLSTPKENSANRRSYLAEANPAAKISAEIAQAIREDHQRSKSYAKTCAKFRVSRSLVAAIVRRELWA